MFEFEGWTIEKTISQAQKEYFYAYKKLINLNNLTLI